MSAVVDVVTDATLASVVNTKGVVVSTNVARQTVRADSDPRNYTNKSAKCTTTGTHGRPQCPSRIVRNVGYTVHFGHEIDTKSQPPGFGGGVGTPTAEISDSICEILPARYNQFIFKLNAVR